jgi:hypothetical protein
MGTLLATIDELLNPKVAAAMAEQLTLLREAIGGDPAEQLAEKLERVAGGR